MYCEREKTQQDTEIHLYSLTFYWNAYRKSGNKQDINKRDIWSGWLDKCNCNSEKSCFLPFHGI